MFPPAGCSPARGTSLPEANREGGWGIGRPYGPSRPEDQEYKNKNLCLSSLSCACARREIYLIYLFYFFFFIAAALPQQMPLSSAANATKTALQGPPARVATFKRNGKCSANAEQCVSKCRIARFGHVLERIRGLLERFRAKIAHYSPSSARFGSSGSPREGIIETAACFFLSSSAA